MASYSKWIIVGMVALMLLSMFAYVASDDDAFAPTPVPAEQNADQ